MAAQILDGRAVAKEIRRGIAARVGVLRNRGVVPRLEVILAGDDPGSAIYVRNKERVAARLGVDVMVHRYAADVSPDAIRDRIDAIVDDPMVHGLLVQLPLPFDAVTTRELLLRVHPGKDVDGFHPANLGRLISGEPGFVPCTPAGCMRLIARAGVVPKGLDAVVIGRSNIVGKPISMLLLAAHATVTMCHSRTRNLAAHVRRADIVIAAVGRDGLVRGDWLKPGACVIDVGINRRADGTLAGDVDFDSACKVAGAISPVPGGVGPMTIAYLLENVCAAAERA